MLRDLYNVVLFLTLFIVVFTSKVTAQDRQQTLYDTILHLDSVFFNAFNTCDTSVTKTLFTKDLEFYHDAGGLTNFNENLKSIRYRCSSTTKVRRELVLESLEVYPIKDFGAIEVGQHKFYYTPPGQQEIFDGIFKFLHIWKRFEDGSWKISRVVSYSH